MSTNADHGVVVQNVRSFTVQIINGSSGEILGTGFIISEKGYVATCAHVISEAYDETAGYLEGEIQIYCPQIPNERNRLLNAEKVIRLDSYEDDIALLKVRLGDLSFAPDQIAVIGDGNDSEDNNFRSFGYRRIEKYLSGRATGTILGSIEKPIDQNLLLEPIELSSEGVDSGLSGAAVLDIERNLVVGIIAETWENNSSPKNRSTAWAINAQILSSLLEIRVERVLLLKRPAPVPDVQIDIAPLGYDATRMFLTSAPVLFKEWVDRSEFIDKLIACYKNPLCKIVTIQGLGGQGKTSTTRRWLHECLNQNEESGDEIHVFWWTFYLNSGIDLFFESALNFVSNAKLDLSLVQGNALRAQVLASILKQQHYILVLDGIETLQQQQGDDYGIFSSSILRDFLSYLSSSNSNTFCVITTRIPVFDLIMFTSCISVNLNSLSRVEGVEIFRKFDVKGTAEQLATLVEDCGGHPLTISLIASYINEMGAQLSDLPTFSSLKLLPHYERVNKILEEYESILTEVELFIGMLFSIFRKPVTKDIGELLFGIDLGTQSRSEFTPAKISRAITRLMSLRLLSVNDKADLYQLHPLVKLHFLGKARKLGQVTFLNEIAYKIHTAVGNRSGLKSSLDQLSPLIEAVYHLCETERFDEAMKLYLDQIDRGSGYLLFQCGAYDTAEAILSDFFDDGNFALPPNFTEIRHTIYLYRALGVCSMTVGYLERAGSLLKTSFQIATAKGFHDLAGRAVQVESELCIHLGELDNSAQHALNAISLYQKIDVNCTSLVDLNRSSWGVQNLGLGPRVQIACSYGYLAWGAFLSDNPSNAEKYFSMANAYVNSVDPKTPFLRDLWGGYYAEFLCSKGEYNNSLRIISENLVYATENKIPEVISQCYRIMADVYLDTGKFDLARQYYDASLREARFISHVAVLIESLVAKANFLIADNQLEEGKNLLDEASNLALKNGYRINETNIKLVHASGCIFRKDFGEAKKILIEVRISASKMGYFRAVSKSDLMLEKIDRV